jgi:hypothetical protein
MMPDHLRVSRLEVFITAALLILILVNAAAAQKQRKLHPPKALLEAIDPEDRDCVTQNGNLNKSVTVQPIRLSERGRQLLIRGSGLCLCGAQNCGFWIYQGSALLLKGPGATKVKAGRSSAKGYRDVVSESHASAAETIVRTYRYDGRVYQLHQCIDRAYYDERGYRTTVSRDRPCEK